MKNQDKDKIREPFPAEETPNPPQIIDPNARNEKPPAIEGSEKRKTSEKQVPAEEPDRVPAEDTGRRLGESPIEIDDETTI
jgi:hypothetical protein